MSKHSFWSSFFGNLAGGAVKSVAKAAIAAANQPKPVPVKPGTPVGDLLELANIPDDTLDFGDGKVVPWHPLDTEDSLKRLINAPTTVARFKEALLKLPPRHQIRVLQLVNPERVPVAKTFYTAKAGFDATMAELRELQAKLADPDLLPGDRGLTQLIYNQKYRLMDAYQLRMKEAMEALDKL